METFLVIVIVAHLVAVFRGIGECHPGDDSDTPHFA